MVKRIAAVLLLICVAFSMASCNMKTVETLFRAFSGILHPGADPTPDPGDHECVFEADGDDRIRLVKCSVDGCEKYGRPDDDGSFAELIEEYKDFSEKRDEIFDFCDEFSEYLSKVEKYDPAKHAYSKGSKLEKESAEAVGMAEQLDEYYYYVSDVTSAVDLYYYSDVSEYGDLSREAEDFSDEFEKKYYEIELACYDCAYREYLFPESEGWTEEELADEMEYARIHSDEELLKLVDAIQDVTYEIEKLDDDIYSSDETCALYEKLIEANNEFAKHLGYENYYVYAMENEYGRDYSLEDVEAFTKLVKSDLTPLMWSYYMNYSELPDSFESGFVNSVMYGSFFDDPVACDALYGFLKKVEAAQPGGESYYDSANDAFLHGNIVCSDSENVYDAAYTDYLHGKEIPMMFFSDLYSDVQTIVHEHGHYHAALTDSSDQVSYDFNEIQSQGAELLYTAYLKELFDEKGEKGFKDVETEMIAIDLLTVVYSLADDEFERALYSGDFDGIRDPERKLSDGVSPDEYDYLYNCILNGYSFEYGDSYWRNSVTKSPCYYLSYAVSMVVSLEIYAEAKNGGFGDGAAAYLGLFDCPNEDGFEDRDASDIEYFCEYTGLASPFTQGAFNSIKNGLRG